MWSQESLYYELKQLAKCNLEHIIKIFNNLVQLSLLLKLISFSSNLANICSFPNHGTMSRFSS